MDIEATSIFVGVLTLVIICGGLWLYFRLKLHNPYPGQDPRIGRRRMNAEAAKSEHGFMIGGGIGGVDYSGDSDGDGGGGE